MGGVIGHALNIGLEYIDKIRKGSANCRGFYCPSYREPAHKLESLFIETFLFVNFVLLITML